MLVDVRLWAVAVTGCLLAGCTAPTAQRSGDRPPKSPTHIEWNIEWNVESLDLTVKGFAAPLVSPSSGKRVKVQMSYANEAVNIGAGGSGGTDWLGGPMHGGRLMVGLGLYMYHAALVYLESGETLPHLTIDEVKTIAPGDGRGGDERWMLDHAEPIQWCRNTLALRTGGDIFDVLDDTEDMPRDWVAMTPESYDEWWQAVDARLHLMEVFGSAGEGKEKPAPADASQAPAP